MVYDDRPRIVETGKEARQKLGRGVEIVGDVVGATLGPRGRNAIIRGRHMMDNPEVISDGYRIADNIFLDDEIENLGARVVVDAAEKTNEIAGDGTSTTVVLIAEIIKQAFAKIDTGSDLLKNSYDVVRSGKEIEEHEIIAQKELKKLVKPVEGKKDLEKIARASYDDKDMAKSLADIAEKIGPDGKIIVDELPVYETRYEIVEGMSFRGRYTAGYQIINDRRDAILEDTPVLVTQHAITTSKELSVGGKIKIVNDLLTSGIDKMVIFAPSFGEAALREFMMFKEKHGFHILAVMFPSLTTGERDDVAVATGATFITDGSEKEATMRTLLMDLNKVEQIHLGHAKRVVVSSAGDVFVVGGKGKKEEIDKKIAELKAERESETIDSFRKKIDRRIASMSAGVAIIVVGAKTDSERRHKYRKTEDAAFSIQHAHRNGYVPGGGLALKKVASKLPDGILKDVLSAPHDKIQENIGEKKPILDSVIDPYTITKTALAVACSGARKIIAIHTAISPRSEYKDWRQVLEKLLKRDEDSQDKP